MATSKRTKDFGSPKDETAEPLVFKLYGEKFTCYPEVQGAKLMRFSKEATSGEQGEVMEALLGFFKTVLYPEDYTRLEDLWEDPERVVPIETIGDIVGWLVEEYTERPTSPSEES